MFDLDVTEMRAVEAPGTPAPPSYLCKPSTGLPGPDLARREKLLYAHNQMYYRHSYPVFDLKALVPGSGRKILAKLHGTGACRGGCIPGTW